VSLYAHFESRLSVHLSKNDAIKDMNRSIALASQALDELPSTRILNVNLSYDVKRTPKVSKCVISFLKI
jgi:hypothetical protein